MALDVLRKEVVQVQWIRELMTLADVNSNKKGGGGTDAFRNQQRKVIEIAPEIWKDRIQSVPFVPKTKGIHGAAIDKLVEEALAQEALAEESEAQPLQDGEVQGAPEAPEAPEALAAAPAAPAVPAIMPAAPVAVPAEPAVLPAEPMEPAANLALARAPAPLEEPALKRRREERQDPGQLLVTDWHSAFIQLSFSFHSAFFTFISFSVTAQLCIPAGREKSPYQQ